LLLRIGTPMSEVIKQCGGFDGEPGKIIMGGPMMGQAQAEQQVPVIKSTSGILVMKKVMWNIPSSHPVYDVLVV